MQEIQRTKANETMLVLCMGLSSLFTFYTDMHLTLNFLLHFLIDLA